MPLSKADREAQEASQSVETLFSQLKQVLGIPFKPEEMVAARSQLDIERAELLREKAKLAKQGFAANQRTLDIDWQRQVAAAASLATTLEEAILGLKATEGNAAKTGFKVDRERGLEFAIAKLKARLQDEDLHEILRAASLVTEEIRVEASKISIILTRVLARLDDVTEGLTPEEEIDLGSKLFDELQADLRNAQILLKEIKLAKEKALIPPADFQAQTDEVNKKLKDLDARAEALPDSGTNKENLAKNASNALGRLAKTSQPLPSSISGDDLLAIFKAMPNNMVWMDSPHVKERVKESTQLEEFYFDLLNTPDIGDDPTKLEAISKFDAFVRQDQVQLTLYEDLRRVQNAINSIKTYLGKGKSGDEPKSLLSIARDRIANLGSADLSQERRNELDKTLKQIMKDYGNLLAQFHEYNGRVIVLQGQKGKENELAEAIVLRDAAKEKLKTLITDTLPKLRYAIHQSTRLEILQDQINLKKKEIDTFLEQTSAVGLDYQAWLDNKDYAKKPGDEEYDDWFSKYEAMHSELHKLTQKLGVEQAKAKSTSPYAVLHQHHLFSTKRFKETENVGLLKELEKNLKNAALALEMNIEATSEHAHNYSPN